MNATQATLRSDLVARYYGPGRTFEQLSPLERRNLAYLHERERMGAPTMTALFAPSEVEQLEAAAIRDRERLEAEGKVRAAIDTLKSHASAQGKTLLEYATVIDQAERFSAEYERANR